MRFSGAVHCGCLSRFRRSAFTLIELLVVITIIIILMGLLFPAFRGVQDQAKRTQAKNDLMQMTTAINAFYTEYGRYPCGAQGGAGSETNDFFGKDDATQAKMFTDLRGISGMTDANINPKMIAFIQIPIAKTLAHAQARSGICGDGHYHDPWGFAYRVRLDNNYNNLLANPYNSNAGFGTLNLGVIAWSIGKDGGGAVEKTGGGDKKAGQSDDDVISWQ